MHISKIFFCQSLSGIRILNKNAIPQRTKRIGPTDCYRTIVTYATSRNSKIIGIVMLFYCKILFFCGNDIVSVLGRQLCCIISCRENFLESKALHFLIYDWLVCITLPDHQTIIIGIGRFCPLEVCTDISRTWLNCHFRQFGYKQVGQVCIQRASITNYHRTIQLALTSHYLI